MTDAGVPIGFRTALAPDEHRESRPAASRIFLSHDSGALKDVHQECCYARNATNT